MSKSEPRTIGLGGVSAAGRRWRLAGSVLVRRVTCCSALPTRIRPFGPDVLMVTTFAHPWRAVLVHPGRALAADPASRGLTLTRHGREFSVSAHPAGTVVDPSRLVTNWRDITRLGCRGRPGSVPAAPATRRGTCPVSLSGIGVVIRGAGGALSRVVRPVGGPVRRLPGGCGWRGRAGRLRRLTRRGRTGRG